jgi:SPP1 family predicted phage head-tail adaptor
MEAAPLDKRVQFRRATLVDDGVAMAEVWADHGHPVWASKTPISDGERWNAGAVGATVTARFRVRHSAFTAAITPKDRIVCDGQTFDIYGIKEIGRRDGFEITAAARAD